MKLTLFEKSVVGLLLVLVCLVIAANYRPGTILSGWDNLHPEFNFPLSIQRSFFGVWQEYQGLGLLGGMGHASDLFRQLILFLISAVLPFTLVRYVFHFSMLLLGPLGVYFLIRQVIFIGVSEKIRTMASLVGAFYYLVNLATVQMFTVPFEPFSVFYGFFPWLLLCFINFLRRPHVKNLFIFAIMNLLASSQGYVGTIFIVYFAMLMFVSFMQLIFERIPIKAVFTSLMVLIIVNAYWLLPNTYFAFKNTKVNVESKSNQMVSEDNLLKNKKFANLEDTVLLKGFWFVNAEVSLDGSVQFQMQRWIEHFRNPLARAGGFVLFTIAILGILVIVRSGMKSSFAFLPLFFLSFAIMGSEIPGLSKIADVFYQLPYVAQIFRTPFTKFSLVLSLSLSVYISIGVLFIVSRFNSILLRRILYGVLLFLPVWVHLPMFTGNLLYSKVHTKLPKEYFQVFEYFSDQPTGRIANFPQYTYWGWTFYRFNYSGSGFLWYGIKQPILDRTFDVWSRQNENYFHEISYALYSGNSELFESVLTKYQVRWLLIDGNVVSYSDNKELYSNQLEQMLQRSEKISLAETFGNIRIYTVGQSVQSSSFVRLESGFTNINPPYKWNNYDRAYVDYGDYITTNGPATVFYPFRMLFTGRQQEDLEFKIDEDGDDFIFSTTIPNELSGQTLYIPPVSVEDALEISQDEFAESLAKYPKIYIDDQLVIFDPTNTEGNSIILSQNKTGLLKIRVPKIYGLYSYDSGISNELFDKTPFNCNQFSDGKFLLTKRSDPGNNYLRLTSVDANNCFDIDLSQLSHKNSYLISVDSRYIEGKNLLIALNNNQSLRADLETYLPKNAEFTTSYFIQPPMEEFGYGYSLHFDSVSIGKVRTVNDLARVRVNPIPYRFLTGLKIVKRNDYLQPTTKNIQLASVDHPNPSYYRITLQPTTLRTSSSGQANNSQPTTTLVLSQSFDSGWHAYDISSQNSEFRIQIAKLLPFLFGNELKDHVLVNNWSNGWTIPPTTQHSPPTTIIIVYLPQYLEYLGFAMLAGLLLLMTGKFFTHRPRHITHS